MGQSKCHMENEVQSFSWRKRIVCARRSFSSSRKRFSPRFIYKATEQNTRPNDTVWRGGPLTKQIKRYNNNLEQANTLPRSDRQLLSSTTTPPREWHREASPLLSPREQIEVFTWNPRTGRRPTTTYSVSKRHPWAPPAPETWIFRSETRLHH